MHNFELFAQSTSIVVDVIVFCHSPSIADVDIDTSEIKTYHGHHNRLYTNIVYLSAICIVCACTLIRQNVLDGDYTKSD